MEGSSSQNPGDSKSSNEMINSQMLQNQMHSPFVPAFQNAQYPTYYPAYSGLPMRSSFPQYALPPKPKRQLNKFTIFEKLQAIDRVHCGETKAHVARSINVAESTLRGWFKNADKLRTLYETEEMPLQGGASTSNPSEFSKIPKKEDSQSSFSEPPHMMQAKSFHNYNYSWLEFYRNFEKLPLQYFDTSINSNRMDEGPDLGRRFLRWMEDNVAKSNKTFNIHIHHLEAFRNMLGDIFRVQVVPFPQARKHIVGDDEGKVDEMVKLEPSKLVERKHIVGDDEDVKDEPKSMEYTDEDDDLDEDDGF